MFGRYLFQNHERDAGCPDCSFRGFVPEDRDRIAWGKESSTCDGVLCLVVSCVGNVVQIYSVLFLSEGM
jgi:hypothetical protein